MAKNVAKAEEKQVEKIGKVLAKLSQSKEFSNLMASADFQITARTAVAYVIIAIKRYQSQTGRAISKNTHEAFMFALGYLLGKQAYEIEVKRAEDVAKK